MKTQEFFTLIFMVIVMPLQFFYAAETGYLLDFGNTKNSDFEFQEGDVRPVSGYISFADENSWEIMQDGVWILRSESLQNYKPAGRIIVDKSAISAGDSAQNTYVSDIIVINGGELFIEQIQANSQFSEWPFFLAAQKKLAVKPGGVLTIAGDIHLANAFLIVEDSGVLILDNPSIFAGHPFWAGTEDFKNGSSVRIQNWKFLDVASAALISNIANYYSIADNAAGYKFGNLFLEFAATGIMISNWTLLEDTDIPMLNLCENNLEIRNQSTIYFITATSATGSGLLVNGNLIIHDGWFNFATRFSGSGQYNSFIIRGDLRNFSDDLFCLQYNYQGSESGHSGSVSVGGHLFVAASVSSIMNVGAKKLILMNGDEEDIRFIDVAVPVISVPIEISSGYRRLKKDLIMGTNASLTIKGGAVMDFGFDNENTGSLALNIIRNENQYGQKFIAEKDSYLKITSPQGITNGGNYNGNVQIGSSTTNRIYDQDAIYHYIGKENQESGNGLPGIASAKRVIVELATTNSPQHDNLNFSVNGLKYLTSAGELEIRKGTVIDAPSNGFADATSEDGKLTMSGGRYRISRGQTQPGLGGKYSLTGGVIEFTGNSAIKVRTGNPPKEYLHIEVSGTNVSIGTTETGGLTFQPSGTFRVKSGGILIVDNPDGFHGGSATAIKSVNLPEIILDNESIIIYKRNGNQKITAFKPLLQDQDNLETGGYYNLKIMGDDHLSSENSSDKTIEDHVFVRNDLEVDAQARLTIPKDYTLVINGKVKTAGADNFIIEHDGSLVQINDVESNENTGEIFVRRETFLNPNILTNKYLLWSSPVANQNMYQIFHPGIPQYVMAYNTATDYYTVLGNPAYSVAGQGYSVKTPANSEVVFRGVPNNGRLILSLNPMPNQNGNAYHAVGNPYPSNFNLSFFYQQNQSTIDASFYFWNNKLAQNTVQTGAGASSWAVFNAASETWNESASELDGLTGIINGSIRPGQAFIIKALGNYVKFSNKQRFVGVASTVNRPNYKSPGKGKLWISLITPSGISYSTALSYGGGKDGLDIFDSILMGDGTSLYTVLDDYRLLIQGKNYFHENDVVRLGINVVEEGIFGLRLSGTEGIFDGEIPIILRDNAENTETNLKESSYQFSLSKGSMDHRFELVYRNNFVLDTENYSPKNEVLIYKELEMLHVKSPVKINEIRIYDMSGRLMVATNPETVHCIIHLPGKIPGIIKILLDSGHLYTKKFQ